MMALTAETAGVFLSTLSLRRATITFKDALIQVLFDFYPRSPCGERRIVLVDNINDCCISIHALLAESDAPNRRPYHCNRNFYPRSPCGERQQAKALKVAAHGISIHALLAESDLAAEENATQKTISIHALLAESDHQQ